MILKPSPITGRKIVVEDNLRKLADGQVLDECAYVTSVIIQMDLRAVYLVDVIELGPIDSISVLGRIVVG
jgi:hypothetical protein